jgi:predicted RNase H-like nuclease (RuvC/YqgF family)
MDMLVKLKEALIELTNAEPNHLQTGVISCASKCDEVLQKLKIEKTDTERELKSRKARIEELTSKLARLTAYFHGM